MAFGGGCNQRSAAGVIGVRRRVQSAFGGVPRPKWGGESGGGYGSGGDVGGPTGGGAAAAVRTVDARCIAEEHGVVNVESGRSCSRTRAGPWRRTKHYRWPG